MAPGERLSPPSVIVALRAASCALWRTELVDQANVAALRRPHALLVGGKAAIRSAAAAAAATVMYTPGTAVVGLGVGRGGLDGGEPCESKGDQERAGYFHCESPTFTTPSGLNTRSPRFSSAILHGPGPAFSSRADLADRAIFLTLAPIAAQRRRSEAEPWREIRARAAAHPGRPARRREARLADPAVRAPGRLCDLGHGV